MTAMLVWTMPSIQNETSSKSMKSDLVYSGQSGGTGGRTVVVDILSLAKGVEDGSIFDLSKLSFFLRCQLVYKICHVGSFSLFDFLYSVY